MTETSTIDQVFDIKIISIQDENEGIGPANDEYRRLVARKQQLEQFKAKLSDKVKIEAVDRSIRDVVANMDALKKPIIMQRSQEASASIKAWYDLNQQYLDAREQVAELTKELGKHSEEVREATRQMTTLKKLIQRIQEAGQDPTKNLTQAVFPDMKYLIIQLNDQQISLPASANQISLAQAIGFALQYGNDLDDRLRVIRQIGDLQDREISLTIWRQDKMFKELAFFTRIPLEVLQNSGMDQSLQDIYDASLAGLIDNE